MVKVYNIHIMFEYYADYIAYFKNETHIYLVCIENNDDYTRFIRIKIEDKNKKEIYDYENYHTYTWGYPERREYEKQN